jgi:hypothetical protein
MQVHCAYCEVGKDLGSHIRGEDYRLSKTENSEYKMCCNTCGCIVYGQAVHLLKWSVSRGIVNPFPQE